MIHPSGRVSETIGDGPTVIAPRASQRLDDVLADDDAVIDIAEFYDGPVFDDTIDIGERIRAIHASDPAHLWPFIKSLLRYMMYTDTTVDVVARKFNVSVVIARGWLTRLENEVTDTPTASMARDTLLEVIDRKNMYRAQCLRYAAIAPSHKDKLAYLRMANTTDNDLVEVLQRSGAMADLPLSSAALQMSHTSGTDKENQGVNLISGMIKKFLSPDPTGLGEAVNIELATSGKVVARPRTRPA